MKKKIVAAGTVIILIAAVLYVLCRSDSSFNLYKRYQLHRFAREYMEANYPDFELKNIDVFYDNAQNYYIVDCKSDNETLTLNYDSNLEMEFDVYYNEKYTSAATQYQDNLAEELAAYLDENGIPCDHIDVYVDLDDADKRKIVYENASIANERIECIITYVLGDDGVIMDKYEFAELVRKAAGCVYEKVGDKATISSLRIKYDYDETKVASISWSKRMEKMSISELADEIKY